METDMSDEEHMSYLIKTKKAFEHLAPQVHWFCPANDTTGFDNVPIKTEHSEIWLKDVEAVGKNYQDRQNAFADCLEFYAYVGGQAIQVLHYLEQEIERNLERCDQCIVEYYKVKNQWIERIKATEDDEASAFVTAKLNETDINRITRKLDSIALTLRDQGTTRHPARSCLLDALSCESFLKLDDLVRQHFDRPFNRLRDQALLHIRCHMPGTTAFLFDPDISRRQWALSTWSGYRDMAREDDFNFAVRGRLLKVLRETASMTTSDGNVLERFWVGIGIIVGKLGNSLITHSFRALEAPDVFRLALDQLHYNATGLKYILQALSVVLERAPKDYWESMGTISPTTVIENIFNPHFTTLLTETWADSTQKESSIKELFAWIRHFVNSLETVHQSQACRAIAVQLMKKLQAVSIPLGAKIECWRRGLMVIKLTLMNCNKEKPTFGPTGRVVAAETLEVVSEYIERILTIPTLPEDDPWYEPCLTVSLDVVELALTLECKSLRTDQETLRKRHDIDPGTCSYGPAIWDKLVQQLVHRNVDLARTALNGINGLMGLEKFVTVKDETNRNYKSDYNVKLSHLTHLVCQMLERINDFDQVDLEKLFRKETTAIALVASLFSPDASTYEAGVNLMKTISTQSARQEAIRHVVLTFFKTTLDAMSWSMRRIAQNRVYASCPRMLTTCKDVLEILCDSQTGLLRSRAFQDLSEVKAVENFWHHQWDVLKVIYEMTDPWSRAHVVNSEVMKEFVRDTMDFSERLFDQYSIFASAIEATTPIKKEDGSDEDETAIVVKRLLDPPARTMGEIVKWLRLRDKYLAGMSVKLTKKVLGRLTEKAMVLAKEPSDFVELVVRGGPQGRTNLELQEKAELARALETNLGRPLLPAEPESDQSSTPEYSGKQSQSLTVVKKAKIGTINLDSWRSKAKVSPHFANNADKDEFGDSDITDADIVSASRAVERSSKLPAVKLPQRSGADPYKSASSRTPKPKIKDPKAEDLDLAKKVAFAEQRKKDIEAKKRRNAEQAAMLRKKTPTQTGSLGIQGKDHAPKLSGVMVSSGSESESEDEIDRDLFGSFTKAPHVSDAVRDIQADRLKQLREQGPVKKTRQVRSAKDMRARLAPDLTSLHKTILGWEYFNNGDFPPGSGRDDYSLVTNTFRNPIQYQDVFEPLLALEGWQGFLKSREEGSARVFEIKVANRLTVDSFVEVATTMPLTEGRDLGLSEADVVLISKGESPATETQQPHCLARVFKISRKKGMMDISYRVNVGNALLPSMTPKATLYGVKILSLTPLEREYGALLGLKYFDLCDEIIRAKPSPILEYSEKQLDSLVTKYKINPAQARAVRSAIDNDAFTLIQGPPGSGKTKTIVAIVGALLTGQFQDTSTAIIRPQSNGSHELRSSGPSATKKLLVCAPSNAAVDELVMRFKDGVKSLDGTFHKPSVVRLGRSDAINTKVIDVTLEELVNAKLNVTNGKRPSSNEDIHQIMLAHKSACDDFNSLRATMDALRASGKATTPEQERDAEILKRKRQQLSNKIDAARDSGDTVARDAEITRRKVQQEILDGAHILCATLSGSGHEMFQSLNIEFETVVIDEAAQSIELSALIPLKYGCSKCILVGDPKQLPPTVLSREAARFQYEQSLFVRMQVNHPEDVHLLDTQYRMHPEISMFPSKEFYDGRLLDGEDMADLRARPWHQSEILGPYRFFDVQGTQQSSVRGHSLTNVAEIDMALKLFARLTTDCSGYDFTGKIGIITPYKSQLRELRSRFAQRYGDVILSTIEFNTTDAFQGRESEVIIFSCVRASVGRGIGFVSDIRRMNVGITRAKSSLWVLGNSQSLMQGEYWAKLIVDAKYRGRYSGSEALDLLQKPLVKFNSINAPKNRKFSTPRDIEMIDAPVLGIADAAPQPVDSVGTSGAYSKAGSGKPSENIVSGGYNGLDTTRSCATCGSTAHYSNMCDNNAAKVSSRGGCHRCGDLDHEQNLCLAERCFECGQFGHTRKFCTSGVALSRSEKDRIKSSEATHKRRLDRLPEIKRKRQLGDHDKSVPVILPTLDNPPPTGSKKKPQQQIQQAGKKRPREPSPPINAPKGPKKVNGGSVRIREETTRQDIPRNIPTGPAATLPPAHKIDSIYETSTQINNTQKLSSDSISPYPTSTKPIQSSAANPKLDAILREGAGETEENPSSAYTPGPRKGQMPNVKPPVKKKKDANLFIIPNKKRK